jgi:exportin-2 (importin alpha re-exporter)
MFLPKCLIYRTKAKLAVTSDYRSIPGLVRLLKTFLARESAQMFAAGKVGSMLAVVQQCLIPSKLNDAWGFELLQSVSFHCCMTVEYRVLISRFGFKGGLATLLVADILDASFTHANKTGKFVYLFAFHSIHDGDQQRRLHTESHRRSN